MTTVDGYEMGEIDEAAVSKLVAQAQSETPDRIARVIAMLKDSIDNHRKLGGASLATRIEALRQLQS